MKKLLWVIAVLSALAVAALTAGGMPTDAGTLRLSLLELTERLTAFSGMLAADAGRIQGVLIVLGAIAVLVGVAGWKLRAGRRRPRQQVMPMEAVAVKPRSAERIGPRLAQISDVETFFLNLYRAQLGADFRAEGDIELVSDGTGPGRQYRLRVFHNDQWRERRMTISPLGEGTSSKSQCFYVIFDTHLVVKIPPVPIADFADYIRRLDKEARIMDRLAGRPCIIPNLSAILSRVAYFGPQTEADPRSGGARCLDWLDADPDRHRYLKIAGAFAFFMDLSRHQFLGHAMSQLGHGDGRLAEVVAEDGVLIDDCQGFEHKYGPRNGPLCFGLQEMYADFAVGLRRATAVGEAACVTEVEKKGWFLARVAGVPAPSEDLVPAAVKAAGDALLAELIAGRRQLVESYRQMATAEGRKRAFLQGKASMAALATNVLDLVAWLGIHRVAMRDLKPDNLIVAGDSSQYPHFLAEAGRFVIGLIDVETAVAYPSAADGSCAQPQLGGTPSYATPSHFFPNPVLAGLYPDLGVILHLQDWYAAIAILFEIVTGVRLFSRTGRLFPEWIQRIRQASGGLETAQGIYRTFSHQVWQAARTEFGGRMAEADVWLAAVTVTVPAALHPLLAAAITQRAEALQSRIAAIIAAQDVIGDARQREDLKRSGPAAVERLMARFQSQTPPPPAAKRLMALLRELAPLKKEQAETALLRQALTQPVVFVAIRDLLPVMFEVVAAAMQPASWPTETATRTPVLDDKSPVEDSTLGFTHTVDL